jgi:DNA-directed RNA polymerase subunit RPC12/RpoP
MIEFSCRQCGKELKVDDSKAGFRGKCPKCSSIIVVPDASTSGQEMIFVDDDNFFSDKELNKFYKQFLKKYEEIIYTHQIESAKWGDCARFEIITGSRRSQLVWMMIFNDDNNESYVIIFSLVGKIRMMESAIHALRSVDKFAPYSLSLGDDNQLVLTSRAKISNLDQDLFDSTVIMVAKKADELEESLFGVDKL